VSRLFRPTLLVTAVLALLGGVTSVTPSNAATTVTVATAIGRQDGSVASVTGYVVGQPTATSTVVRSNFPNDYALALADSATQTSTSSMLYVQIPAAFRASY
jgi:ABC-type Fe3+-hydroxamate transport system substrate-binding protein